MSKEVSKKTLEARIQAGLKKLCPKRNDCYVCEKVRTALTGEKAS